MACLIHPAIRGIRLLSVLLLPILVVSVLPPAIARADNRTISASRAEQAALEACNALSRFRMSGTPAPQTATATQAVTPVASQQGTAQVPTPSNTPRPAPTEDRVGFPEGYQENFKLLFFFDRPDSRQVRAICGNDSAAARQPGEPFAYGSVLVMETYRTLQQDGKPVLDQNGHYIFEGQPTIFVMRKEKGFGEAYKEDRSGEWEYTAYRVDKSYQTQPINSNACAACHLRQAGESVDFVFRTSAFGDSARLTTPPAIASDQVQMFTYAFLPSTLNVKVGTTITWINNDEAEHTVTTKDKTLDSPRLKTINVKPGDSFSFKFEKAGTYDYFCSIHTAMKAKVIVAE
jgi:plastocyanin